MSTLPWRSGSGSSHIIVNLEMKSFRERKKMVVNDHLNIYFLIEERGILKKKYENPRENIAKSKIKRDYDIIE